MFLCVIDTTRQAPTSANVFSLWDGCLTLLSLNFLMNYMERVMHFLQVVVWSLLHQNTQISDITIITTYWDCTSVPYKEISGCFPTSHPSLISLLLTEWDLFSPLQAHLWLAPSLRRLHGSRVSMIIILASIWSTGHKLELSQKREGTTMPPEQQPVGESMGHFLN